MSGGVRGTRGATRVLREIAAPPMTEEQEQACLAQYLDGLGLLWWHTPNGGKRGAVTAKKLKGAGVKAGVPDVFIASRLAKHPQARGAFVELKRTHGGTVSPAQQEMIARLKAEGYLVHVARGWQDAARWLADECGVGRW